MKRLRCVIGVLLWLWVAGVAASQPEHPSADGIRDLLQLPRGQAAYIHTGRVVEAIDSNNYTYILVDTDHARQWLAAPKSALYPGQKIRFPDGALMRRFYSKILRRTFENILFVSGVMPALEKT